ncbi:hypothetical protein RHMOL_Rhmol06G0001800 [Rhododendron molle]|uniref:Uncharacterized protein n=1 Tax=Rhododendron molle TaxID=49168 RepID=A0ACC0N722_RHOML|nr:hypothetical protein RHMOL_Rhmol06G0001800 [Rhododendron molle]
MWAPLTIAGPNSKNKGSLYYSYSKTGMERCKYFKWCLSISEQSHVSTNNGAHVVVLQTKVDLLEQSIWFMKNIINGLLWYLLGAIVIIFFEG